MAVKGKRKQELLAHKAQKKTSMFRPGGQSHYARKRAFLNREGGWGWQWPGKPWK